MSEQLAIDEKQEVGTAVVQRDDAASVDALVRLAMDKDLDVEMLERLVALRERVTERAAEEAMARALARFQAECPPIPKTMEAEVKKDGRLQYTYKYAGLDPMAKVIRPTLVACGLSFTHDGEITDKQVSVTCTLHHVEGAKKTATFTGPIDTSGGKNPIQQVSSARSYGRRYTLMDVLGITTGEEDDDGVSVGGDYQKIDDRQLADLMALLREVDADEAKFRDYCKVERLADLAAAHYAQAIKALEAKRGQAKSKAKAAS